MSCDNILSNRDIEKIYKNVDIISDIAINSKCLNDDIKEVSIALFSGNRFINNTGIKRKYLKLKKLFSKSNKDKVIEHMVCEFNKPFKNNRLASKIHQNELNIYQINNFKEIHLNATYDGLVVWIRKPFEFKFIRKSDEITLLRYFREYLKNEFFKNENNKIALIQEVLNSKKNFKSIKSDYFKGNEAKNIASFSYWLHNIKKQPLIVKMYKEVSNV